ncbi:MAG: LicD family protein [Schwartzia sp.]|nr:LicD family protein [Schwartzia sp. (in: firmicutes)]
MSFVKDIGHDEIRSGFLVTTDRKKIWEKCLEIFSVFDEICKKYGLKYFAYGGSLLGAARHHGFIPWDDDIDIAMLRPDYARFQEIAKTEIREPYFYQTIYSDTYIFALSKLRDSRTTAVQFPEYRDGMNQGMFIDIYPFDIVSDELEDERISREIRKELLIMALDPEQIKSHAALGLPLQLPRETIVELSAMSQKERFKFFDDFSLDSFNELTRSGKERRAEFFLNDIQGHRPAPTVAQLNDLIEVPFENLKMPIPREYDEVLAHVFGDWHEELRAPTLHDGLIISPDIPYSEYFEKIKDIPTGIAEETTEAGESPNDE